MYGNLVACQIGCEKKALEELWGGKKRNEELKTRNRSRDQASRAVFAPEIWSERKQERDDGRAEHGPARYSSLQTSSSTCSATKMGTLVAIPSAIASDGRESMSFVSPFFLSISRAKKVWSFRSVMTM